MSAKSRNSWIILTMIALMITGVSLIKKRHRRVAQCIRMEQQIRMDMDQEATPRCFHKRKKRRHGMPSAINRGVQDTHPLIERKQTVPFSQPASHDFYLPDQLPVPQNYDEVRKELKSEYKGSGDQVVMRLLVNEKGEYVNHEVLQSSNPDLQLVIEPFLPLLHFTPALYKGKAVQAWVNIPFRFQD